MTVLTCSQSPLLVLTRVRSVVISASNNSYKLCFLLSAFHPHPFALSSTHYIESDDDGVDMGPSKITLVECRESLKDIANFIAQDACLGEEYILQVQKLANKLLAVQTTCVMNRKQEVIMKFFPVVGI